VFLLPIWTISNQEELQLSSWKKKHPVSNIFYALNELLPRLKIKFLRLLEWNNSVKHKRETPKKNPVNPVYPV
jgi:hypothetical protein